MVAKKASPVSLSSERIVDVAATIVRERGVDGLTMRVLSEQLGVSLGATYRHVATKRELLLLLAQSIYAELLTHEVEGDPLSQVRTLIVELYDRFAEYPGLVSYIGRHADQFESPELVERILGALVDAGTTRADAERLILIFVLLISGSQTVDLGEELNPFRREAFVDGVELLTLGEIFRSSQQR